MFDSLLTFVYPSTFVFVKYKQQTLTADGTIIGTPTITASINPSITTATTNVNVHQVIIENNYTNLFLII